MSTTKGRGRKRPSPELSSEEEDEEELSELEESDDSDEESSDDRQDSADEDDESDFNSDCEPLDEYEKGGYADVEPGSVVGRYTLEHKLGWGHFSTVWASTRAVKGGNMEVAVKIIKSHRKYTEMADDEIQIFRRISRVSPSGHPHLIRLVESFSYKDANGLHRCLVFQCQGPNLYRLIREEYQSGIPLNSLKRIGSQFYQALFFLHHNCNLIHTDLKPENLLLTKNSNPSDPTTWRLVLSDLGNVDEPKHAKDSYSTVQTRHYRSPEVILRHGFDYMADIWSAGCVMFELATGTLLFEPESGDGFKKSEDHLAMMISFLGPIPLSFLERNHRTHEQYFNTKNQLRCARVQPGFSLESLLEDQHGWESKLAREFAAFLSNQLKWTPKARSRAGEILKHAWFTIKK